jgi:hypothetical protein
LVCNTVVCNFEKDPVEMKTEVLFSSNNPTRVYFDLTFEGTHFTPSLQQKFFQLMKEQPLQRYKNFLGYLLGQFLIFSEYYTDYTTVPLTFRVLNLTYTSDLMDKNSYRYKQHARLFCEDVSE